MTEQRGGTLTAEQAHTLKQLLRRHNELRGWEARLLTSLCRGFRPPTPEQWLAVETISARVLFGVGR